ncbi:MAG TPA: glycine cleavage system protein GcvH [Candidatus Poseidoniales archaeon]|nr:glycine cleavage system protein GcvH [Candidatus Poseidoniales archaeon]
MSGIPANLRYTAEHEWIRIEAGEAVIGITDFAQNALTDVVWVELPEVGSSLAANESCGSVESVKSVSEIFSPIAGEVLAANEELEDAPEQINENPYGAGWIWRMAISDTSDVDRLLDAESYRALIGE